MANYPRYAIYYAPARGSVLDRFGAAMLGYDAYCGTELPFPDGIGIPDWHALTQDPRKYGFHATFKAPFTLARGRNEEELVQACAAFAGKPRDIPLIEPIVDGISGFIAIIPATASNELTALAADCVREFDGFRAPLAEADRTRRKPDELTPRQREYLDRWGYPYVFEEFRFHMTLTGRLEAARRAATIATLRDRFCRIGVPQIAIDRMALFLQADAASRFRIIESWPLRPNGA